MKKFTQIALIAAVAVIATGTQSCAKRRNLSKPAVKAEEGASKDGAVKHSEWMESFSKAMEDVEAKEKAKSDVAVSLRAQSKVSLADSTEAVDAKKEAKVTLKTKNEELIASLEAALKTMETPPADEKEKRVAMIMKAMLEAKLELAKADQEKLK